MGVGCGGAVFFSFFFSLFDAKINQLAEVGDGSGGAVFSREEAAEVFRKIDRDGSGDISMLELIKVLNPKLKP